MPGRYPKLIEEIEADNSRIHKTKAEIEARKAATPQGNSAYLRAPDWLNDVARREWRRDHTPGSQVRNIHEFGLECAGYVLPVLFSVTPGLPGV